MGALMLFVMLSSAGLPGLNGFVGEFTILLGSFSSQVLGSPWFAGVATLGVILAAVYLFVMFEKVFLGPVTHEENTRLKDINLRETLVLLPILVVILWIGLYPNYFFSLINPSVERLTAALQAPALAMH
jgi:NADH-quinone oxidoreductase subunit M